MDVNQEENTLNKQLVYPEITEIYTKLMEEINMCHNTLNIYIDDLSEMKLQISDVEVKLKKQFIELESIYNKYCEMEDKKNNLSINLRNNPPEKDYESDEEIIVV